METRWTGLALVCTGMLLAAPRAHGQAEPPGVQIEQPEVAQRRTALIEQGLDQREKGEDSEALATFERALQLYGRDAQVLAQIALAEQALGRFVKARRHLSEALSDQDHPWIEQHAKALRGALEGLDTRVGRLEIIVDVDGAQVRVAGEPVGSAPLSSPVAALPGLVSIAVEAEGYFPALRRVMVSAGKLARTQIELEPEPQVAEPEPAVATDEDSGPHYRDTTRRQRNPRWFVGVGAGVALSTMAAVSWSAGENKLESLQADCPPNACTMDDIDRRREHVERLDRATNALLFGGIALTLASSAAYLFWKKEHTERVMIGGFATPGSAEVHARVRF